jgi:NADPH-dependent 2,4-dienoyl-CoA reductase/sulfur reductase-like enzyme/nitrite reductase/ring-hydroxylating ferredoxin subunit
MGGGESKIEGPDLSLGVVWRELVDGEPLLGHVDGEGVILVRQGSEAFAVSASCTHYGGPLAEGFVAKGSVRCPWHHARYDLRTGRNVGAPGLSPISCYEVSRDGDHVVVGSKRAPEAPEAPEVGPRRVVIVGAGAAGEACAETLREQGFTGSIVMFGPAEPFTVDRPNLSKDYLAGEAPEEWLPVRDADFFDAHDIRLVRDEVDAIDATARTVRAGEQTYEYDALVLATGAEPRVLPTPGADLGHVHTLRSLDDARRISERAEGAATAVVIGAGFIGLEAAASLTKRDTKVTVVAPEDVPLARVMGAEVGAMVRRVHERNGVAFELGHTVDAIAEGKVTLDDGRELDADLVIMGVGVAPRVALAEEAGLEVDGGVVVDETLRASEAGVWAAGDVARYPYKGARVRVEHWVVARRQGQAVARAIIGRAEPFTDTPFFWSHHWDVGLSYVGHASTTDHVTVHGSLDDGDAAVVYRGDDGVIQAVLTVGRDGLALHAEHLLEVEDHDALEALIAEA